MEQLETRNLLAADFGDAPSPYPSASHEAVGATLGALRDTEAASQPTITADGDGADEDGVTFGALHVGQLGATVTVNVQNAPTGAVLNAWIDFDGNGAWSGVGEQIFVNRTVVAGDNVFSFNVPATVAQGLTYARFRLRTSGGAGFSGSAPDGEVEDYSVTFFAPPGASAEFSPAQVIVGQGASVISSPKHVVPADLDADGDLDVVYNGQYLAWSENLGSGVLSERQISTTTLAANSLAVEDLDGDGDLDIILSLSTSVIWRENDGTGSFTSRTIASGLTSVQGITVADLDGDGDQDVAAVSGGAARVAWFENNGAQTFASHTINTTLTPSRLAAADMDRDGDLDLVVAGSNLTWLENNGSQAFTSRSVSSSLAFTSAIPVDLDRDGDMDVVTSDSSSSQAAWYENDGFQVFTRRLIASGIGSTRVVTGAVDLDGDGDVDVLATSGGRTTWYANDGSQGFTAMVLSPAENTTGVAAGDLDGDGALDLISIVDGSSSTGDKLVWRQQLVPSDYGDAPAPYETLIASGGARHRAIGPQLGAARDVEADGVPSGAADSDGADDDGVAWAGLQVGQLGAMLTVDVQNAPAGARVDAWIDFNADGDWGGADEQIFASAAVVNGANVLKFNMSAVAASGVTFARVRLSTAGNLGFVGSAADGEVEDYAVTIAPSALASGLFDGPHVLHASTSSITAAHAADIDADGEQDVVAIIGGRVAWFERQGGAYVERTIGSSGLSSAYIHSLAVADLDGDGDLDVIVAASYTAIRWFENDGHQNFTLRTTGAIVTTSNLLAAMDVNGDGHLDLVTTRRTDVFTTAYNPMVWFENDGHQQFTERYIGVPSSGFTGVTAADFDGNGVLDFLASGPVLEIFRNPSSTGVFQTAAVSLLPYPFSSTAPLVADMDADGDLDIVVIGINPISSPPGPAAPTGSSSVIVLQNNGAAAFTPRYVGYITTPVIVGAAPPRPIALGDVEGDGDVDVLGPGVWMENLGGLGFANHTGIVLPAAHNNLSAADMDGDGDLDALASTGGSLVWFENRSVSDVDFGDAPAPYDVLRTSGGAFHGGGGPRLGATRDTEVDGAPSAAADADAGDDGITFGVLRVGDVAATVTVNVQNAAAAARLSAWIDFNGDGVWAQGEEQIFADVAVAPGDHALTFSIPAGAVTTQTFARFRLSSGGGLGPSGAALDGEVEDHAVTLAPPAPATTYEPLTGAYPSGPDYVIRTVDLDGDGDLDMIGNGLHLGFYWQENLGASSYLNHSVALGLGIQRVADLQPVDYDRDGDVDVVTVGGGFIGWFENNGGQTFAYRPLFSGNGTYSSLTVADLDGDGDFDILPTLSQNPLALWWYRNDGRYQVTRQTVPTPITHYQSIRAADMDRDGDVDIVVGAATNSNGLYCLVNDGKGAFTSLALVLSARVSALTVVDLDRDGDLDVVSQFVEGSAGRFEWFENPASPQFARHNLGSAGGSQAPVSQLAAADLDGDNDFDLVLGEGTNLRWHRNDGSQNFSAAIIGQAPPQGGAFTYVHVADVNDDGDLEVLTNLGNFESRGVGELSLKFLGAGNYEWVLTDEVVDGDDFLVWQREVGSTLNLPRFTDWDRNGVVDGGDLEIWRRNFGAGLIPDIAWINSAPVEPAATSNIQSASATAAEPALAANMVAADEPVIPQSVILRLKSDEPADRKPTLARRPAYRPPLSTVAARDAALASLAVAAPRGSWAASLGKTEDDATAESEAISAEFDAVLAE